MNDKKIIFYLPPVPCYHGLSLSLFRLTLHLILLLKYIVSNEAKSPVEIGTTSCQTSLKIKAVGLVRGHFCM